MCASKVCYARFESYVRSIDFLLIKHCMHDTIQYCMEMFNV